MLEVTIATEQSEVESLNSSFPYLSAAGDGVRRLIHPLKIDIDVTKVHGVHSATDIHADHRGYDLVGDGHSRTDGTALARVNVGHNSDLRGCKRLGIAYRTDLLCRIVVNCCSKAHSSIKLSNYLYNGRTMHLHPWPPVQGQQQILLSDNDLPLHQDAAASHHASLGDSLQHYDSVLRQQFSAFRKSELLL